jgi:adenylylsulfate kinase
MDDKQHSTNITRSQGRVTAEDRHRLLGQRGCVVWFTGLSGSGKSTLAHHLESRLVANGRLAWVLDGDNLRHGLCGDLTFAADDRTENIRRAGEVASLMAEVGVLVLASFISPYREDRSRVRATVGDEKFLEVHVDAPLEVCEARDPKGLYAKARQGLIPEFTGISAPYEAPEQPDIRVNTHETSVEAAAAAIEQLLTERGLLTPPAPSEETTQ